MYVELVEGSITNRGKIVELNQVPSKQRSSESYITLFPFDKSILPYVSRFKTVKGFRGLNYVFPALFIDIDNEGKKD